MTASERGIAIDPGGGLNRTTGEIVAHCGWAEFEKQRGEWCCVAAGEWTADECVDAFIEGTFTGKWNWAVIEEWKLYPEQADRHVGSDFPAVQLIGALKHAARWAQRKARDEGREELVLAMQPASIQEPTAALLRKREKTSMAKATGAGGHALSAELHGWYYLIGPKPGAKSNRTRGRARA